MRSRLCAYVGMSNLNNIFLALTKNYGGPSHRHATEYKMDSLECMNIPDSEIEDKILEVLQKCMDTWAVQTLDVDFTQGKRQSYHQVSNKTYTPRIVFGLMMVRACMMYGSKHDQVHRGWDAVVHVVCHEFAHTLAYRMGRRFYGEVHTPDYFELYDAVVQDFMK